MTFQRLHAKVPYGHSKAMTSIVALHCDRIDAPYVFDLPINAATFTAWVEQQLCPTLAPGDIVIMDNLQPQECRCQGRNPGQRGAAGFPAALQPRPQSHRAGLRKALEVRQCAVGAGLMTPEAHRRQPHCPSTASATSEAVP
jgi:hypothetical protein